MTGPYDRPDGTPVRGTTDDTAAKAANVVRKHVPRDEQENVLKALGLKKEDEKGKKK